MGPATHDTSTRASRGNVRPSFDQSLSDTIDRLLIARDNAAPGFRRQLLCWRLRWYERRIPSYEPERRVIVEAELPAAAEVAA